MPRVTVLMPVHNGSAFLQEAIRSVLGQTFTDFELLIVDDGSTDDTAAIATSVTDSRVRIICSAKRLKLAGALNTGMDSTGAEYVARMDADDVCLPGRLAAQVSYMDSHPAIGMSGGCIQAFSEQAPAGSLIKFPLASGAIKAALLFDNPFAHPTTIFRRELFNRFQLRFDGRYYPAEDYELWSRALECFPAANLGALLLRYRLHPHSMTLSGRPEMDAQSIRILKPMFSRLGMSPRDEDLSFHRFISTNRVAPDWNRESVERAERWLGEVVRANGVAGTHDPADMSGAVGRVWFSVAYRSLGLGSWMVWKYLRSPLHSGCPSSLRNRLILVLAALKQRGANRVSGAAGSMGA